LASKLLQNYQVNVHGLRSRNYGMSRSLANNTSPRSLLLMSDEVLSVMKTVLKWGSHVLEDTATEYGIMLLTYVQSLQSLSGFLYSLQK
jgi:hypothetical protein